MADASKPMMGSVAVDHQSSPRVGNLPADATSFVGRRNERADARRLLADARLVTLTGVGGVGKTRLALRVAASLHRAFAEQVWLVDLTELSDPGLLAASVAETLHVPENSRRDALSILTDHVRDRQLLLVLDNCEHLLQECAVLADTLLRNAPGLRILATSRQPLNVPDEHTMLVPPLPTPEAGGEWATGDETPDQYAAVALFVERAVAVQPDFALTADNRDVVIGICRRLDGIPLAIELAAARLKTLTPQQILERLDNRYKLLTHGPRSVPPRHQSLQALIDWSYDRMSTAERLVWLRSSVFAGSFDLEAAEAVCSGAGIERGDVMDLVTSLIDRSILVREGGADGVARYRQLETIREYGRSRLAEIGEVPNIRRLHRDHFQRIATQTRVEGFAAHQLSWFRRVELNYVDLRLALEFCATEPGEAQTGLRMAADLRYHWVRSYYLNEGRSWFDRLLALDQKASRARADALWTASWLAIIQGDISTATSMLDEARALGEALEEPAVIAYAALYSGFAAMYTGDTEGALRWYDEALQRHRAIRNQHGVALTLIRASLAYAFIGDSKRAIGLGEECLALCNAVGDVWHKAYALMALGVEVWREGDSRRGRALEQESLRMNLAMDSRLGISLNLEILAWIAADNDQFERAAQLLGIVETMSRSSGAPLAGYGHLARYQEEALDRTREALGEESFDHLLQRGAGLTFRQAIAYALGEKVPAPRPASHGAEPRLTRREREIAGLVAQGQSNREIASTLVIAQRTAESHVENILVKLGFTSRAQIAAWVAAREQQRD